MPVSRFRQPLGAAFAPFAFLVLMATTVAAQPPANTPVGLGLASAPALAGSFNAFGPETFTRDAGQPVTATRSFSVRNPSTQYTLRVRNAGAASAVVILNGREVLSPSAFSATVDLIEVPVVLERENALSVDLRSAPGSSIVVEIEGIDNDPPTVSAITSPVANSFGWHSADVTVAFVCDDATSTVVSCPSPVRVADETSNRTVSGEAVDAAGNRAATSVTIRLDKTAPSLVAERTPLPNANGWHNTDVTVTFRAIDALSGVDPSSLSPPITLVTEGAGQSAGAQASDLAGNVGSARELHIDIDKTPPAIAIASPLPGAVFVAPAIDVTGTVTDSLSGIGGVVCPSGPAAVVGQTFACAHSLTEATNQIGVQATDLAGNIADDSVNVTLAVDTGSSEFTMALPVSTVTIPRGASVLVPVRISRATGVRRTPVLVSLDDPPPGCSSNEITFAPEPAGLQAAWLTVSVDATVPEGARCDVVVAAIGETTQRQSLIVIAGPMLPRAQDLIRTALEQGRIDYGTSLLYRQYALFGDSRLPLEFRGSGSVEDNALAVEINLAAPTLPATVLDALRPYRLRPDEAGSAWGWVPATATAGAVGVAGSVAASMVLSRIARVSASSVFPPAPTLAEAMLRLSNNCLAATTPAVFSERHPTYPVRVHIRCPGGFESHVAAAAGERALAVVDSVWAPMTGLMGPPILDGGFSVPDLGIIVAGGDEAIDIYMSDLQVSALVAGRFVATTDLATTVASAITPAADASSAYVLIPLSTAADEQYLPLALAHELFHLLQYAHTFKQLLDEATGRWHWANEASAVWAESAFSSAIGFDTTRARRSRLRLLFADFQNRQGAEGLNEGNPYTAFVWFMFVEMKTGSSAFMREIWDKFSRVTSLTEAEDVVESVLPYRSNFSDFALRNLNGQFLPPVSADPLPRSMRYASLDSSFPDLLLPQQAGPFEFAAATSSGIPVSLRLQHLSTAYKHVRALGNNVRQLTIDWSNLAGEPGVDVRAVIFKAGSGWEIEDYSGRSRADICVDTTGTPSIDAWFLFSNGDRTRDTPRTEITVRAHQNQTPACNCTLSSGNYCFTPLVGVAGTLFEGLVYDISESGVIAGSSDTGGGTQIAATWQAGTRSLVGALPGDGSSTAFGVNKSGDVVGYSINVLTGGIRAFLKRAGKLYDLGALTGFQYTGAQAISDTGVIVGWGQNTGSPGQAVIWKDCGPIALTQQFGCTVITPAPGTAIGVNSRGEVLITTAAGNFGSVTVFDLATGTLRAIGPKLRVWGTGLNRFGDLVATRLVKVAPAGYQVEQALLFRHDGSMSVLACPYETCSAIGLNDHGAVVGAGANIGVTPFANRGLIWRASGVAETLPIFDGSFYFNGEAIGINNAGEIALQGNRRFGFTVGGLMTPLR
jgi:hypothetical protein